MNKKALIFIAVGIGGFFFMRQSKASEPEMQANFGMGLQSGMGQDSKPSGGGYYVGEVPASSVPDSEQGMTFGGGIKTPDNPQIHPQPPEEIQADDEIEHGGNILNIDRQLGWNGGTHFTRLQ